MSFLFCGREIEQYEDDLIFVTCRSMVEKSPPTSSRKQGDDATLADIAQLCSVVGFVENGFLGSVDRIFRISYEECAGEGLARCWPYGATLCSRVQATAMLPDRLVQMGLHGADSLQRRRSHWRRSFSA